MMISSTLVANGATVYIIGPGQEELNKYVRREDGISSSSDQTLAGSARFTMPPRRGRPRGAACTRWRAMSAPRYSFTYTLLYD